MKKFITYALVLLSAICCAVGLAACDTTEEGPDTLPHEEHTFGVWTPSGDHKTHFQTCPADGEKNVEACEYSEIVVPATCEAGGSIRLVCPTCGDAYVAEETPSLGHKYTAETWTSDGKGNHYKVCETDPAHRLTKPCSLKETVVPATCEEQGYTLHTCEDCGYTHMDSFVEPLEHAYDGTWRQDPVLKTHSSVCTRQDCGHVEEEACTFETDVVPATCEADGYTVFTCKECGLSYQDVPVPALGHKWKDEYLPLSGEGAAHRHYRVCENDASHHEENICTFTQSVKQASCQAGGFTTNTCPLCEYSYITDRTEQLEHAWGVWTHDAGAATHSRTCSNEGCSERQTDACKYSETTFSPTCVQAGKVIRACDLCEDRTEEPVAALGHDYGDPVYQKTDGKNTHVFTCERDGCAVGTEGHTKAEACVMKDVNDVPHCTDTVDDFQMCEKCGYSEDIGDIAPVGHKWEKATDQHPEGWTQTVSDGKPAHTRTCSVCKTTETVVCDLTVTVTDATCTAGKTERSDCARCGYTKTETTSEPLGHNYRYTAAEGGKQHTVMCLREDCAEHAEKTVACAEFTDDVTLPTCDAKGYTTHTCTLCGGSYRDAETGELGHIWILKEASKDSRTHVVVCSRDDTHTEVQSCSYEDVEFAASCTAGGYHLFTCTFCKHSYQGGETDPLGHSWHRLVYNAETHEHSQICSVCNTQESEKCTFEAGEPVAPTCQKAGYTLYTCIECGGSYEGDPVETSEHRFGAWTHIASSSVFYPEHQRVCEDCGAVERRGCDLQFEVIDPTCTDAGYTRVTCKDCNRAPTKRQPMAAYGHSYDGWTYTGDGETHTHAKVCTRCGTKTSEKACNIVSSKTTATCYAPGVESELCSECGHAENEEVEKQLNHDLSGYISKGNGGHYRYCQRPNCNYTEEGSCNYATTFTPASCTSYAETKSVCDLCGHTVVTHDEEQGAPTGHKFSDKIEITDTEHKATCSVCGYVGDGAHDYSESNMCSICGYGGLVYERPTVDGHEAAYYIVKSAEKVSAAKNIIIPDRIDGIPVEYLSPYLFYRNSSVESVVLPRTLKEISRQAFASCAKLRSVIFAEGEEAIALGKIDPCAFQLSAKLETMEFPQGLTEIGEYAFSKCTSLRNIDLPDSVTEIGTDAFRDTGLYNSASNWENGALYLNKHLIKVNRVPDSGECRVNEGTVSISRGCFENLTLLKSVYLPATVLTVDADAFKGCTGLQKTEFGGNVAAWLSIDFENDLASPMHFASELHIDGAEPNADGQTLDLSKLEDIRTFTEIPAGTFRGIKGIKKIVVPAQVTGIGSNAFFGCSDLASVEILGTLKELGTNILDGTAFYEEAQNWEKGVLYLSDANGGHYLLEAKNEELPEDGKVTVRAGTHIICADAFNGCTKLTEVTIPESVNFIGANAFVGSGLLSAKFEGEKVAFFAFNKFGAGRYYDTELKDAGWAANNLKNTLSGQWTKRLNLK